MKQIRSPGWVDHIYDPWPRKGIKGTSSRKNTVRRWDQNNRDAGTRESILAGSHCDLLEGTADETANFFKVINVNQQMQWLLLCDDPKRLARLINGSEYGMPPNVSFGLRTDSGDTFRLGWEGLMTIPTMRFVVIGNKPVFTWSSALLGDEGRPDWVVVQGESHVAGAIAWCREFDIPCYVDVPTATAPRQYARFKGLVCRTGRPS